MVSSSEFFNTELQREVVLMSFLPLITTRRDREHRVAQRSYFDEFSHLEYGENAFIKIVSIFENTP